MKLLTILHPLDSPVCAKNQVTKYSVAQLEDAEVTCSVDANPPNSTFKWAFNNTADTIDVPSHLYTVEDVFSIITYTPNTALDYGTLLCYAQNKIGLQKEPCLYHIVPASTCTNIFMQFCVDLRFEHLMLL